MFSALRGRFASLVEALRELTLARALAALSALFMIAIIAADLTSTTPAKSSNEPAPPQRSDWIEMIRAPGAFALESSALEGLEQSYVVRRHRQGRGRLDLMTWGTVDGPGAYVRLALYRPGTEPKAEFDPLDAAVAVAADAAIDARLTGPVAELKTKFGALPILDMYVWSADGPRACLAVAGTWSAPRLEIVAWWCNRNWELVRRGQVACLIDRLVLISAGSDTVLASFFARAELTRDYCGAPPSLVATPKRADDWMFVKAKPELRGQLSER